MLPKTLTPEELALLTDGGEREATALVESPAGDSVTAGNSVMADISTLDSVSSDIATVDSVRATPFQAAGPPPALRRKLDLRRIGGRHALLDADLAMPLERLLGEPLSVQWLECEAISFGQLLWTMPPPTCLGVVESGVADRTGPAETLAVHMELELFYSLLDRLLQGSGSLPPDARRPLTEVEQRLALRLLRPLTAQWETLWQAPAGRRLNVERIISHPQRLQAWTAETLLVVNRYRVHGERANGTLQLIAPWDVATELLDAAVAPRRSVEPPSTSEQLPAGEWTIELRDQTLTEEDLVALQPGDLLATDHAVDLPLLARSPSGVLVPVQLGQLGDIKAVKRTT